MNIGGVEYFPVTSDPDKLALIREQDESGTGSRRLGAYAHSLGLTPPGHTEGDPVPAVVLVFANDDAEGVYVWNIHERDEPADEPELSAPDEPDPWATEPGDPGQSSP